MASEQGKVQAHLFTLIQLQYKNKKKKKEKKEEEVKTELTIHRIKHNKESVSTFKQRLKTFLFRNNYCLQFHLHFIYYCKRVENSLRHKILLLYFLLKLPEFFRVLLSCANQGFCYLNLTVIKKSKYERKIEMDSGSSCQMMPPCKWPIIGYHRAVTSGSRLDEAIRRLWQSYRIRPTHLQIKFTATLQYINWSYVCKMLI